MLCCAFFSPLMLRCASRETETFRNIRWRGDKKKMKTSAAYDCFYSVCFSYEGIKHTQPAVASDLRRFVNVFGHAICVKQANPPTPPPQKNTKRIILSSKNSLDKISIIYLFVPEKQGRIRILKAIQPRRCRSTSHKELSI